MFLGEVEAVLVQVVGLMDGPRSREGALSRRTGRGEAFGGEEEENGVNGVQSGLILAAERDGVLQSMRIYGMDCRPDSIHRHSRCLSLVDEQHSLAV